MDKDIERQVKKAEADIKKASIDLNNDETGIIINDVEYILEKPVYDLIVGAIKSNMSLVDANNKLKEYIVKNQIMQGVPMPGDIEVIS